MVASCSLYVMVGLVDTDCINRKSRLAVIRTSEPPPYVRSFCVLLGKAVNSPSRIAMVKADGVSIAVGHRSRDPMSRATQILVGDLSITAAENKG